MSVIGAAMDPGYGARLAHLSLLVSKVQEAVAGLVIDVPPQGGPPASPATPASGSSGTARTLAFGGEDDTASASASFSFRAGVPDMPDTTPETPLRDAEARKAARAALAAAAASQEREHAEEGSASTQAASTGSVRSHTRGRGLCVEGVFHDAATGALEVALADVATGAGLRLAVVYEDGAFRVACAAADGARVEAVEVGTASEADTPSDVVPETPYSAEWT